MTTRVHPTAIIEEDVVLGEGTSVWDHAHIRHGARLGCDCIVGGKSYIAYDVVIGDRVKINANVYICNGVTIEQGTMVSAGVIFTNDRFPRATSPDLRSLRTSEPDEHTLETHVREGCTIGAGAVIGPGLELGRFSMIGMGSVVTASVPAFGLVVGNPARLVGFVCRCGQPIVRLSEQRDPTGPLHCTCGLVYSIHHSEVSETQR